MSKEIEQATEKIARRMAREDGQPEALWELYLMAAYQEYYGLPPHGTGPQ
jgi:hypothetical protein